MFKENKANIKLGLFFLLYGFVMLFLAYNIQPMHDYGLYFAHWDLVLNGGDPWQKMEAANAYGPIYNAFAWLYAIDRQLPKLVFTASWLFISFYVVNAFWNLPKPTQLHKVLFLLLWLFNPFFILSTIFYGFNDAFVAFLVFLALLMIVKFKRLGSGVALLSLGVLTKIYPLFLLPFIANNKKQLLQYSVLFVFIIFSVYLFTYFIWGGSFLNAFGKANGRDPTLFSVMRFLTGAYFPSEIGQAILAVSNLLILLGIGYVYKLFMVGKIDQITAFLASFTVLLMFYKAGQQQFYLVYFAIFALWSVQEFKKAHPNHKAFYAGLVLGLWMSIMAGLVYPFTGQMEGAYFWLRDVIGLPTFFILVVVMIFLLTPIKLSKDNVSKFRDLRNESAE